VATALAISMCGARPVLVDVEEDTALIDPARIRDAAAADHAGLAGLCFMHLRHTAVTRLAELGCSTRLIANVTGHAEEHCAKIIARYLVTTEAGARTAFAIRLEAELGTAKRPKLARRAE